MQETKIVIGIVEKDSKVLLIKRKVSEGNLMWAFPGGKVEYNETEEDALKREVLEETGIECELIKKLGERIHPDTRKNIIYWLCKYIKGDLKPEEDEVEEAIWATSSEIFSKITSNIFDPVREYLGWLDYEKNKDLFSYNKKRTFC